MEADGSSHEKAIHVERADEFEALLRSPETLPRELWLSIFKKSTGRQTVTFEQLLDVALCYGWVDTKTKGIDDERYGIRFVPRRPKSDWSPTNRAIVRRLLAEGRMQPAGLATLPDDLTET